MKVYEIDVIDSGTGKYTYACGYGPFEGMKFFDDIPTTLESFKRFWEVNPTPPGLEIEGGSVYPDVLGCGNSPPGFFLSQRVVDSLAAHGIHPWRVTPVPIGSINSRSPKLMAATPPQYNVVEADYGITVDWDLMGYPTDKNGRVITKPRPRPRIKTENMILIKSTWNEQDLFLLNNYGRTRLSIFCTERVKQIADLEKWTNVKFIEVKAVY